MENLISNSGHREPPGHNGHSPFLAHHFENEKQQFDAGKLGIWIFLVTEILFFGGLFCAYAVYRVTYPEVFEDAAHYLNVWLGALNTLVLIFSSLTVAWAVRAAQLNQRRATVILLAITLVCAAIFLGVKFVEYKQKWEHGLLWSGFFNPVTHDEHGPAPSDDKTPHDGQPSHDAEAPAKPAADAEKKPADPPPKESETPKTTDGSMPAPEAESAKAETAGGDLAEGGKADQPPEVSQEDLAKAFDKTVTEQAAAEAERQDKLRRQRLGTFFAIYFGMTGLHGIHVIAGILVIGWVLMRAKRGDFSSDYFGPVDYTALYWHLVDMIWIYLFPLLYLIH